MCIQSVIEDEAREKLKNTPNLYPIVEETEGFITMEFVCWSDVEKTYVNVKKEDVRLKKYWDKNIASAEIVKSASKFAAKVKSQF